MLDYKEVALKANQYLDLCLASDYGREQQVVNVISSPNVADTLTYRNMTSLMDPLSTIKIEHFETFDRWIWEWCITQANKQGHHGPFSAHVFIAPEGGYTFKEHTDPDDVLVCVVSGEKTMVVEGVEYTLRAGEELFMPANVPHYAVNKKASVMISLGLEKWMVDKL